MLQFSYKPIPYTAGKEEQHFLDLLWTKWEAWGESSFSKVLLKTNPSAGGGVETNESLEHQAAYIA